MEASFWRRLWTCRQTEYWMNEWIQPHWLWLAERIGLYFHMHAFSRLSVIHRLFDYVSLLAVLLLHMRSPVEFLVQPHFTFTLRNFFVCSTLGSLIFVSPWILLVPGGLWVYGTLTASTWVGHIYTLWRLSNDILFKNLFLVINCI